MEGRVGCRQTPVWSPANRGFDPMLFQYWPPTHGPGPILKQHWVKSSCLLGSTQVSVYTQPCALCTSECENKHICVIFTHMQLWIVGERLNKKTPRVKGNVVWCFLVHLGGVPFLLCLILPQFEHVHPYPVE